MNERDYRTQPPTITIIPWCCRHKWTLAYTALVVTLLLIARIAELSGWIP